MFVSQLISGDEAQEYEMVKAVIPEKDRESIEIWFRHKRLPPVKVKMTLVDRKSFKIWSHSSSVEAGDEKFITTTDADNKFEAATIDFIKEFMGGVDAS
jgi:hypothetical protein